VIGERTVKLYWSSDGKEWRYKHLSAVNGIARGTVRPLEKVTYKAVFWGDSEYAEAHSHTVEVYPVTAVTTPAVAPTTVKAGAAFSASGFITPDHSAGNREVRVQCFRLENGEWVLRKTVWATCSAYPGPKARYGARVSLSQRGRWRLRALHPADDQTRRDVSAHDYLTVK
jgi:hypothetical protein